MLEIKNLQVSLAEEDKEILKGVDLTVEAGKVHAIMGPNGSGKSTLSYVLSGKDGYEVTGGSASLDGEDLLELEPEERAAAGLFLAFQYPVEIPGVGNMTFLRTAVNAQRKARGEDEMSAAEFLKVVRERAKTLKIDADMLKRPVNVGFSGARKSERNSANGDVRTQNVHFGRNRQWFGRRCHEIGVRGCECPAGRRPWIFGDHTLSTPIGSHQTRCCAHHGERSYRENRWSRIGA